MAFPALDSAPCPPYFMDNIYDIFVAVAVNQSLTVAEYTTIANNCNIFPSTTSTKAIMSSVTTEQSSITSQTSTTTSELSTESTSSLTTATEQLIPSTLSFTQREQSTESSRTSTTFTPNAEESTEQSSSLTTSTEQSTASTSSSIPGEQIRYSTMAFPTLESAPCPPYFVDNIYDIFVTVAINQSLTEAEYMTVANNCNIVPSTTTTKAIISSVTTEQSSGTSTTFTPTTELSIESTSSFPVSTETPPSPSASTDRLTETTSSPSTSTERLTETTSLPSTERLTTTPTSPSTSTERLTTTTTPFSPSTSTEHLAESQSSPSTSRERLSETTYSQSYITPEPSTETTYVTIAYKHNLTEATSSISLTTEHSTEVRSSSPTSSFTTWLSRETIFSSSLRTNVSSVSTSSTLTTKVDTITPSSVTGSSSSTTTARPFVTTEQSPISASPPFTALEEKTLTTTSLFGPVTAEALTASPVILAANSCNDVCKMTLGVSVSLFLALCILVFIFLKLKQTRKHRTTKYKIHGFGKHYPTYRRHDQVMHGNFSRSSLWKSDSSSPITFYRGYSRHLSDKTRSIVVDRKPLHFVDQIYLPDIDNINISENNRHNRRHHLRQSSLETRQTSKPRLEQSKSLENYTLNSIQTLTYKPTLVQSKSLESYTLDKIEQHSYKPALAQSKSFESYTLDKIEQHSSKPTIPQSKSLENYTLNRIEQPPRDSIYKSNHNKPTTSSIKRKSYKESRSKGYIMGNPYSLEGYESESFYGSNSPSIYDGPITFTPEFDRRPFPKVSSDIRREMIEQSRDSRRDNTGNQSRRRSRSHDPNLQYGYIERQFSFDLDPDCPGLYRPAGRYKKHNQRQRKVSTASREFNMDNMNRYSSEAEIDNNNYIQYDGYGHNSDGNLNSETNSSLRNRNTEQKVISSILKNGKPPNNRSRSDCSGEGMEESASAADVFDSNRNRSLSHGTATIGETKTRKPNTIYFYQTRL